MVTKKSPNLWERENTPKRGTRMKSGGGGGNVKEWGGKKGKAAGGKWNKQPQLRQSLQGHEENESTSTKKRAGRKGREKAIKKTGG